MNTAPHTMTLQQERVAYKRAVQRSLVVFFGKSSAESAALVGAWWKRMRDGAAFQTGLFMHYEPVNTAAGLAGTERTPSIRDLGEKYEAIIVASMPKPRRAGKKRTADQSSAVRSA